MVNVRRPRCWNFKHGVLANIGMILLGLTLQISVGPIDWGWFAAPVNLIFLVCYVALIVLLYSFRRKVYAIRWSMTYSAAVPSILITGVATLVYGITCNRSTLTLWPFVLCYFWLTTILGLTCLKHWKSPSFLLNHLGLFIAIVAATLGSADMQRLRMRVMQDSSEWRAVDDNSMIHEMDFSIQLNSFSIDEYPPTLVLINSETGDELPAGQPVKLLLDDTLVNGHLLEHSIKVEKLLHSCVPIQNADSTIAYIPSEGSGATTAALVSIDGSPSVWVSNGSYMYPERLVPIDDKTSLFMPQCEPKYYTSNVTVVTHSGKTIKDATIEVNKPLEVDGWKIYQVGYDTDYGRWSMMSVFELVHDPWLPFVYLGIFMLLAGALFMFITAGGKKS